MNAKTKAGTRSDNTSCRVFRNTRVLKKPTSIPANTATPLARFQYSIEISAVLPHGKEFTLRSRRFKELPSWPRDSSLTPLALRVRGYHEGCRRCPIENGHCLMQLRCYATFFVSVWLVGLMVSYRGVMHLKTHDRVPSSRLEKVGRLLFDAAPRRSAWLARLYLWTALSWCIKIVAFAAVLYHFVKTAFWKILSGVMGTDLSCVLPFHGIAGSGSYELATSAAMVPFRVRAETALSGAVNLHLFLLGTTLTLAMLVLIIPLGARAQRAH